MRQILGIDPGVNWSAMALIDVEARSVRFGIVDAARRLASIEEFLGGEVPCAAVVEGQQVYRGLASKKVDANDIVALANEAGRIAGIMECGGMAVEMPLPATWKGSVDKSVHNARVVARMASEGIELRWGKILTSQRNHYIDALGLAMWLYDGKRMMRSNNPRPS